ncbi:hypothetical protein [Halegenticoccus tardaugens]|uniref:hypothetical protein n=1 Tax=Halegenticoccus tardaugens TaxID=2071624 RepID=UPI00100AD500|nr:hypothetical protein [Halegenticoccus tardaugens]
MSLSEPALATEQAEQSLESRLTDIEAQLAQKDERITQLEDRVTVLEVKTQEKAERIEELEGEVEWLSDFVFGLEENVFGEYQPDLALTELEAESLVNSLLNAELGAVPDLKQRLIDESNTRGKEDALLTRKLNTLADEVNVELTDGAVAGQDKITRLLRNGPEDVADRVYQVHYRARDLLAHAREIGTPTVDTFGRRITFDSPTVARELGLLRNESLTTSQVKRVFEKIHDLAQDSHRRCDLDCSGETNKLVIYLDQEDL